MKHSVLFRSQSFILLLLATTACSPEYSLGSNQSPCDGSSCTDAAVDANEDLGLDAGGSRCDQLDAIPTLELGVDTLGDTRTDVNETTSACGGAFGPENVWRVVLPRRARLAVRISEAGASPSLDAAISLRSECSNTASEVGCESYSSLTSSASLVVPESSAPPLDPGTYFVYVDGLADARGTYAIRVDATFVALEHEACGFDTTVNATVACDEPSTFLCGCGAEPDCSLETCERPVPDCGDGIVSTGEACDSAGDDTQYCTTSCEALARDCPPLEPQPAIVSGQHYMYSTVASGSHFASEMCGGAAAGDYFHRLEIIDPGTVARVRVTRHASSSGPYRAIATLRKECPSVIDAHDLACGTDFSHAFGAGEEGNYFLWIDGLDGEMGVYDLLVELAPQRAIGAPCTVAFDSSPPTFADLVSQCASGFCFDGPDAGECATLDAVPTPVCGDGQISRDETCDDHNMMSGDGCSAVCQLEADGCRSEAGLATLPANASTLGSILGQTTTTDSACGGARSGDDRYVLRLPTRSRIVLTTDSAITDFATSLDVRRVCVAAGMPDTLGCSRTTTGLGATLALNDVPAGAYFVTVDGLFGATGSYEISSTIIALAEHGEVCEPVHRVPDHLSTCIDPTDTCVEAGSGEYRCM